MRLKIGTDGAKQGYHHGDLAETLLDLAEEELELAGEDGLSLRALARRAGVTPNAPYRHFTDKSHLLVRLAARGFMALVDRFEEVGGALEPMGVVYVDFARERPRLFRLMFGRLLAEATPEGPGGLLLLAAEEAWQSLVRAAGSEERALAIWAMTHGLADLTVSGLGRCPSQPSPTPGDLLRILDGQKG
ncbi:MAG: TetR/AcrR family transcriptional regulator [Fimbriimonadaceae bacterium]|nr:TetR/AcrR family transcriptional regulator [Fimbriimonadaceae bacterium]